MNSWVLKYFIQYSPYCLAADCAVFSSLSCKDWKNWTLSSHSSLISRWQEKIKRDDDSLQVSWPALLIFVWISADQLVNFVQLCKNKFPKGCQNKVKSMFVSTSFCHIKIFLRQCNKINSKKISSSSFLNKYGIQYMLFWWINLSPLSTHTVYILTLHLPDKVHFKFYSQLYLVNWIQCFLWHADTQNTSHI